MVKKRKYVIRSQEWLPLGHKKASGGLALFFFYDLGVENAKWYHRFRKQMVSSLKCSTYSYKTQQFHPVTYVNITHSSIIYNSKNLENEVFVPW